MHICLQQTTFNKKTRQQQNSISKHSASGKAQRSSTVTVAKSLLSPRLEPIALCHLLCKLTPEPVAK